MALSANDGREHYQTQSSEYIKQYLELDGSGRIYKIFTAGVNQEVNGPCEVTYYYYADASTTVITARKEGGGIWTQAMQTIIDTLV